MESDRIEQLLEKYFEATSTAAEEKALRAYFSKGDVAAHLEPYAPMFQYFSGAKEERFTKQVALPKTNKSRYQWLSIAASVIVVFGLYFGNRYQVQKEQEQQEALYAYEQTKKALGLLAENFSKGTEKVAYLNEFEETKQKIYNHH